MFFLGIGREILRDVVTAVLTTALTELAQWGIDELRNKYGSEEKEPEEENQRFRRYRDKKNGKYS